jgi:hypothetical protein
VEVQPELPLASIDFVLIVNVLVNLLDNAIKYSPADLPVTIDASLAGSEIQLRVWIAVAVFQVKNARRFSETSHAAPAQARPRALAWDYRSAKAL